MGCIVLVRCVLVLRCGLAGLVWYLDAGFRDRKRNNIQLLSNIFVRCTIAICGPGSSVGIAIDYGLDGQGSNPGGDDIFRPSRPALGPTQPPAQRVPGLSRG